MFINFFPPSAQCEIWRQKTYFYTQIAHTRLQKSILSLFRSGRVAIFRAMFVHWPYKNINFWIDFLIQWLKQKALIISHINQYLQLHLSSAFCFSVSNSPYRCVWVTFENLLKNCFFYMVNAQTLLKK